MSSKCVCMCTCPTVWLSAWIKPHNWWKGAEKQRPTTYLTMMQASQDIQSAKHGAERGNQNEWNDDRMREQEAEQEGTRLLLASLVDSGESGML